VDYGQKMVDMPYFGKIYNENLVLEKWCYWEVTFVMGGDMTLERIRQRVGAVYRTTDNILCEGAMKHR
jgi:hypothetical protein